MSSRPLWHIPDPADAIREAQARHEFEERQRRDRVTAAADRKAKQRREKVLLAETETRRRAQERREWFAAHEPPTSEELEKLLGEFPNLKGKIRP